MEVAGNSDTGPIVFIWILGELVGPDTVGGVISLVVVHEELSVTITVEIDHGDVVSTED